MVESEVRPTALNFSPALAAVRDVFHRPLPNVLRRLLLLARFDLQFALRLAGGAEARFRLQEKLLEAILQTQISA